VIRTRSRARGTLNREQARPRRLTRFSIIGIIGIAVQLGSLEILRRAGFDYLLATVIAVEVTILHNFIWHERYTWRDRAVRSHWEAASRLLRFQLANGAVSLAGNAIMVRWLVGEMHLPVLAANLVAITACWLLNFLLGDRLVFTGCEV